LRKPAIALLSSALPFREHLTDLLTREGLGPVVEHDNKAALFGAAQSAIDVLIIDVDYESDQTMALVHALRAEHPTLHIVLVATPPQTQSAEPAEEVDREALVGALVHGFRASASDKPAHRNWSRITARQRDVMRWLSSGLDNATIGQKLRIGERAVKAHISSLLALFGLENRTQLALLADRAGLRAPRR